jgi:hypothetical protein
VRAGVSARALSLGTHERHHRSGRPATPRDFRHNRRNRRRVRQDLDEAALSGG